ncbi:MAG: hypothetical protein LLG03_03985 [Planctomycetaceae bacterium]|nr:hypothetical protein [Planctomycetaceae bacterium]
MDERCLTPIRYKHCNTTLVADGCNDLPVFNDGQQYLTCWKLSWRQLIDVIFRRRVWLCILGSYHPPVWVASHVFFVGPKASSADSASSAVKDPVQP